MKHWDEMVVLYWPFLTGFDTAVVCRVKSTERWKKRQPTGDSLQAVVFSTNEIACTIAVIVAVSFAFPAFVSSEATAIIHTVTLWSWRQVKMFYVKASFANRLARLCTYSKLKSKWPEADSKIFNKSTFKNCSGKLSVGLIELSQ